MENGMMIEQVWFEEVLSSVHKNMEELPDVGEAT